MDISKVKEAAELIEELQKLSEYKKFLSDKQYKHIAHFEFHQHYGGDGPNIKLAAKYNREFIPILDSIIQSIESKIKAL